MVSGRNQHVDIRTEKVCIRGDERQNWSKHRRPLFNSVRNCKLTRGNELRGQKVNQYDYCDPFCEGVRFQGHKFGMSGGDKTEDHSLLGAIMKKDSEAKGAIAVHARRPSLRSDLVDLKNRAVVEKQRIKEFESSSAQKIKEMCTLL